MQCWVQGLERGVSYACAHTDSVKMSAASTAVAGSSFSIFIFSMVMCSIIFMFVLVYTLRKRSKSITLGAKDVEDHKLIHQEPLTSRKKENAEHNYS